MQSKQKIPDGWSVRQLKDLTINGIFNGIFNDPKKVGRGCPLINVVDLYNDYIDFSNLSLLDVTENELRKYEVIEGDLLFTRSSLKLEGIAHCNLVRKYSEKVVYDCHLMRIRADKNLVVPYYLYAFCSTKRARRDFVNNSKTTTMTTIDQKGLGRVSILLPPLAEQEKIAEILGTWDDGIEKLGKLIEAKKLQKKGMMQKLLTGKYRLQGFSEPWKEKYLVDICDFNKGQQLNKADMLVNGKYPVLNGGISYSGYTNDWNTKANMITISEGGNSCGFVSFIKEKFWCGGHCYTVFDIKLDTMFLYHLLKYNENNIMNLRVGSGLPNIQISSLYRYKVLIPSELAEQRAIAEILSNADEEIELLSKKLEAFKQEKKGLMQQLLTGKIRVRVN